MHGATVKKKNLQMYLGLVFFIDLLYISMGTGLYPPLCLPSFLSYFFTMHASSIQS